MIDVAIIGNGIIGLSAALELARGGANCTVLGASEPGGGSGAAAGILAPSVGERDAGVREFFHHSLSLFPDFLEPLREFDPNLALLEGLLEIISEPSGSHDKAAVRLTADDLRRMEPALAAPFGALLHERDAAIDSTRLLAALRAAASRHPRIDLRSTDGAASVDVTRSPAVVTTRSGAEVRARFVVLAAGAWSPSVGGLPRRVPVFPQKGQIISLDAPDTIHRAVMGGHTYMVPRGRELVVGATIEHAGFDTSTTPDAAQSLFSSAVELCPALADARVVRHWAGLRPATDDLLPILGPDPEYPSLIYACGHSRNGILLAPGTARAVRSFCEGSERHSRLPRFSIERFV